MSFYLHSFNYVLNGDNNFPRTSTRVIVYVLNSTMSDSESDLNAPPYLELTWMIENMPSYCYVKCPTIYYDVRRWFLSINCYNPKNIELAINREGIDGRPDSIEMKIEFSILGKDGLPLVKNEAVRNFVNYGRFIFDEFADKLEVFFLRRAEFLPNGALTVRCRMWEIGTETQRSVTFLARSRFCTDRYSFVWSIKEFSSLRSTRRLDLRTTSSEEFTFSLTVEDNLDGEIVTLRIEYPDEILYSAKISLLGLDGEEIYLQEKDARLPWKKFLVKKSTLMKFKEFLLPNNVLSLKCEVDIKFVNVLNVIENISYSKPGHHLELGPGEIPIDKLKFLRLDDSETSEVTSSLPETIKPLVEEAVLSDSDVCLQSGSKSFAAHECILSARSPVFKAMFSGDMKEKTSKCVEIPDVDEDTLRELLSYIYTDKVKDLECEEAIALYRAADKYELLDLKKRCADFLKSRLNKCACDVLKLADMHHDQELREAVQGFIKKEGPNFFTNKMWKSFKLENMALACDVLEEIFCNAKKD